MAPTHNPTGPAHLAVRRDVLADLLFEAAASRAVLDRDTANSDGSAGQRLSGNERAYEVGRGTALQQAVALISSEEQARAFATAASRAAEDVRDGQPREAHRPIMLRRLAEVGL